MNAKDSIRAKAIELGFEACAFTSALAPASAPRFQEWLDQGRHGEMLYLARNAHKRIDPNLVLPGALSVVCLAASYHIPAQHSSSPKTTPAPAPTVEPAPGEADPARPDPSPRGVVARYARHPDYHDLLAEPLRQLAAFIDALGEPGTRSLWYLDTGPVLERDLAQRAGLGFVGKHTNLIHPRLGNWLFLAEVLTTLPLEPDAPARNRCGSCTRCLDACPTNALPAPFQLDARRCISYLTIELKGSIPEPLRPLIGRRIYGCDDCLEACPWNRFAAQGRLMSGHRRDDLNEPDLIELLALDQAGFKARFAGTPMLRTKRRGLLRNVCVALGNSASPSALPALARAAADPEPLIAEHAAWAIQEIQRRHATSPTPATPATTTTPPPAPPPPPDQRSGQ